MFPFLKSKREKGGKNLKLANSYFPKQNLHVRNSIKTFDGLRDFKRHCSEEALLWLRLCISSFFKETKVAAVCFENSEENKGCHCSSRMS